LELGTNGWNAAAALAATALQPSWAATGTVSRAEAAMMLASADSNAWIAVEGGTGVLYRVTPPVHPEYDAWVSVVSGSPGHVDPGGYHAATPSNKPPGVIFTSTMFLTPQSTGLDWSMIVTNAHQAIYVLTGGKLNPPGDGETHFVRPIADGVFGEYTYLNGTSGSGVMQIEEQRPITNRYPLATQTGTAILISEHNESTDASIHPTLPRLNDVVNIVGAATNPLLPKAEALATNAAAAVQITGLYASNATVFASVGALELGTNGWNAAAALAATALQPDDAAGLTVAEARRLVAADTNSWSAVEGGTNWLYTISYIADTNSLTTTAGEFGAGLTFDFQADRGEFILFKSDGNGQIRWDRETSATPGLIQYVDTLNPIISYANPDHYYDWPDPDGMPVTLTEAATGKTMTLDWGQRQVTNRVQIGTQPGTVILLSEHDADAGAHPTLPRYDGVSNIVSAATNPLLSKAEAAAAYLSATPGWFWQGSQAVVTNGWAATLGGYAAVTSGVSSWALVPYTTTRHDTTGSVEIVSDRYIVGVGCDWYVVVPEDLTFPKTPVRTASERLGPTSWVLRAWCSTAAADANPDYYAVASNVTVMTYDRQEMTPGLYTNDAAGIVSRVDDAPTTDARRAVNVGTLTAYVDGRKTEIADHAWRRTPGGRDAPSAYTVTLDQPLVQQGAMAFLNSGNYYCMSYEGGDWYSAPTGSVWRIGPSGTAAFEIQATNRVLFVSGFSVSGGYATLDIATNWVTDGYSPEIEYTETLDNPQWLACPEQTMTNMVSYWRGVCPATADSRFFRAVQRNGASLIKSHYAHEFAGDIILFGQRYSSLAELKAALEALP
ncbi:MAG TPA: hypothetical protein PLN93_06620, partial [Vicinamibacterales bacterium]|nr:hypothetical protein [Vicinamibacterales bacterium]